MLAAQICCNTKGIQLNESDRVELLQTTFACCSQHQQCAVCCQVARCSSYALSTLHVELCILYDCLLHTSFIDMRSVWYMC
jgi:hypothetical protein